MSILSVSISSTTVNYTTPFSILYEIGLSELTKEIEEAQFVTFIPHYMDYLLPSATGPILSIRETYSPSYTIITFKFTPLLDVGLSIKFQIQYYFKYDSEHSTSTHRYFSNKSKLYINDLTTPMTELIAPEVQLVTNSDFRVIKRQLIPQKLDVALKSYIIWEIKLTNKGDPGACITNFNLTDQFPKDITLYPTWSIIGKDTSNNIFADTRYDGRTADSVTSDRTGYTFTLPGDYCGTEYTIVVIAATPSSLPFNQYNASLTWYADSYSLQTVGYSLNISEAVHELSLDLDIPYFTKPYNFYYLKLNIHNTGNVAFSDTAYHLDIPKEIVPYQFNTGIFGIPEINYIPTFKYSIYFTLFNPQTEKSLKRTIADNYTSINRVITASLLAIPDGYRLTKIEAVIPYIPSGFITITPPGAYALVNEDIKDSIQTHLEVSYIEDSKEQDVIVNKSTTVSDNVCLMTTKQQILPHTLSDTIGNNQLIRYVAFVDCPYSYLYEPIIIDFLPPEVTYVGNERFIYYDFFNNKLYDSLENPDTFPLPLISPTQSIDSKGRRVLRFSYTDKDRYTFRQHDTLTIEFDVIVSHIRNSSSLIKNTLYLGNNSSLGIVGPGNKVYQPTESEKDQYGISNEYLAMSNTVSALIIRNAYFKCETFIQVDEENGFIDGIFPPSVAGGHFVTYRFILTNIGETPLYDIEIIQINPHENDTAIMNPNISRGSLFTLDYISSSIAVTSLDNQPSFKTYYCDTTNPIRFDKNLNTIGTQSFKETIDGPVKALKLVQENSFLPIGQKIALDITYQVPEKITSDKIAFNSIAIKASYQKNNETVFMSPIEPLKKGIKGLSGNTIEGIVFLDSDGSGIWNTAKKGINRIVISLYNASATEIARTSSVKQYGLYGYYRFSNLPPGKYWVLVSIDKRSYKFTSQLTSHRYGSQVNAMGFTSEIVFSSSNASAVVFIGLIYHGLETIHKLSTEAKKVLRSSIFAELGTTLTLESITPLL